MNKLKQILLKMLIGKNAVVMNVHFDTRGLKDGLSLYSSDRKNSLMVKNNRKGTK